MKQAYCAAAFCLVFLAQAGLRAETNDAGMAEIAIQNASKMSQLGKAIVMYSMDNAEMFPPKLDVLNVAPTAFLREKDMILWTDPATGKKTPFLYRTGMTAASDAGIMLLASPFAFKGKRDVLLADGSVETMEEDEFIKKAAEQKWIIPKPVKKEDVDQKLVVEIKTQIQKLGDSDSKVRSAARTRLKEIGVQAMPFLEEELGNPDPEIQISIKQLLGQN